MMNPLERLALQRGIRINEKRRIILQILDGADDRRTAQDIHRCALELDRRIGLSTVYRLLKVLSAAGLVTRVELPGRNSRYEKVGSAYRERVIDLRTGRVLEFRSDGIEALLEHAVAQLGYRLLDYRLELFAIEGADSRTADFPCPLPHRRFRQ